MVQLRAAEMNDIDLIYRWANDPVTRKNSFNSNEIKYEEHVQWFKRNLMRDDVRMYILFDDNKPIGQIRLNICEGNAEISYIIAPDCRGMGYGRKIISLVVDEIKKNNTEIVSLVAQVKPDNYASKSIFEKEGFEIKSICYELKIGNDV